MRTAVTGLLLCSLVSQGCAARTKIQSQPSGATIFVDGQNVGKTPYVHRDRKIVGSTTDVRLEKPGYETLNTSFKRDEGIHVGALIGGLFFLPVFLWITDYRPERIYSLTPVGASKPQEPASQPEAATQPDAAPQTEAAAQSKAERLRELDKLLQEKLITQEEYDTKKKQILDEL